MSSKRIILIFLPLIVIFTGCSPLTNTQSIEFQDKYKDFDYCELKAVKQAQSNSCGSACITSVLNYWGIDISEGIILGEFSRFSDQGYSIPELKIIALQNGIQAYAISLENGYATRITEQILKGRPVICAVEFPIGFYFAYNFPLGGNIYRKMLWEYGARKKHYIVVFGTNHKDKLLIMDPAYGFAELKGDNLYESWGKMNYAALLCVME